MPFFRQLWLVSGVKLMEMNSNFFSRYYYMSCAGLMAGTQYFCLLLGFVSKNCLEVIIHSPYSRLSREKQDPKILKTQSKTPWLWMIAPPSFKLSHNKKNSPSDCLTTHTPTNSCGIDSTSCRPLGNKMVKWHAKLTCIAIFFTFLQLFAGQWPDENSEVACQ